MNILYASCTCSQERFVQYVESKGSRGSQQAQKYNLLLAEGLAKNGAKVTMISSRPINRAVEKRLWLKGERETVNAVAYDYLPFVNYPVLRHIWILLGTFFHILFAKCSAKDTVIVCDALNISSAMAALAAGFVRRMKTMAIVTDVPGTSYAQTVSMSSRINLAVMQKFDSYLLLTEPMTDLVNPKNRPYIVLEGHADMAMASVENTLEGKQEKKVVLYAGSLMEIYGIGNLVEGFLAAAIPETQLHIYGDGDYVPKLKQLIKGNPQIKYWGVAPNSQIVRAELAATLLVNPRPTNEEYTKYSFPSKNMEYMASGTPVLTTRLPGMPEEYYPYVYLLEEESAEGVEQALRHILSRPAQELAELGEKAKQFVMNNKNNISQAGKVLQMLQTVNSKTNMSR